VTLNLALLLCEMNSVTRAGSIAVSAILAMMYEVSLDFVCDISLCVKWSLLAGAPVQTVMHE